MDEHRIDERLDRVRRERNFYPQAHERERERERTKKERAAFLRVSFGDVCLEDVRWVSHSYEEVEYARGNERLCDERRVTVRLKVNVNNRIYNKQLYLKVNGARGRQQVEIITTP